MAMQEFWLGSVGPLLYDDTGGTQGGLLQLARIQDMPPGAFAGDPLTASNTSTVDNTYGSEEAAVINNLRTRLNEVEAILIANGFLSSLGNNSVGITHLW